MMIGLKKDITKNEKNILCFVEMKRLKGSNTSKEQKEWLEFINSVLGNVEAVIKYGCQEAIEYIDNLIKPQIIDERPIQEQGWFKDQ